MSNWIVKLVLMNCAVVVALYYRWSHGAPIVTLAIFGAVLLLLINVLVPLTRKKSSPTKSK